MSEYLTSLDLSELKDLKVDRPSGEAVSIIIDEDDYVYLDERSYQRDVYLYFENLRLKREAKVIYDKLARNKK